ncbi:MAG: hypothetical protein ACOCP8_00650 [archaeon]
MINLEGRIELFRSLVGSNNYNLNTEESDKDYKLFFLPTFNDLYSNKYFKNSKIGNKLDVDAHDIRKVEKLWYKVNVNFLEVLFSENIIINKNLDKKTRELLFELLNMKNDIIKMNLPYLFDACRGMFYNKMHYLEKGTSGTQHLVNKYSYDTKQALHSWRILDFLKRFKNTDFNNFKEAIWYKEEEKERLLAIKEGKYSLKEFKNKVEKKLSSTLYIEKDYKAHKVNKKTYEKLQELIKAIVKHNI